MVQGHLEGPLKGFRAMFKESGKFLGVQGHLSFEGHL